MAYVPWIIQKYWCSFDVKKHPSLLLSARQGPSVPTPPTSRRVLVPLPANTTFKTRSAARRPHVRGACSALAVGEGLVSAERRKISAWRGHEDNGGEGQLGREPGYSGGGQFFPKENLCKLLFVWILLSLSLVKVLVKVKFSLAPFVFVQYATACDQGLSAETCNASWKYIQRKNEGCLLVVYKEIWEKN